MLRLCTIVNKNITFHDQSNRFIHKFPANFVYLSLLCTSYWIIEHKTREVSVPSVVITGLRLYESIIDDQQALKLTVQITNTVNNSFFMWQKYFDSSDISGLQSIFFSSVKILNQLQIIGHCSFCTSLWKSVHHRDIIP